MTADKRSEAGPSEIAFDFGENWKDFSRDLLDEARVSAATASVEALIGAEKLAGARFCDVGCGSGLFTLAAARLGIAEGLGVDINATAIAVARANLARFGQGDVAPGRLSFAQGSALDRGFMAGLGTFDIVYAWGSLHHTGRMVEAITNTAATVAPGGILVLAIYNHHWTTPIWTQIKIAYNRAPAWLKRAMVGVLGAVIYVATLAVTGKSPLRKERGMDFWYDVIDWLGGYPYEAASRDEIVELMRGQGFSLLRHLPPRVPTGCNEFVFQLTERG